MNLADLLEDADVSALGDLSAVPGFIWLVGLGLLAGLCILFMLPTVIAFRRAHPHRWAVLIVNVVFGATGILWIGCLLWALGLVFGRPDPGLLAAGLGTHRPHQWNPNSAQQPAVAPGPTVTTRNGADGPDDALGAIARLQALRAAGHLGEDEFARMKGDAIARWQRAA